MQYAIRLFKAGIERSKSDERSDLCNATDWSKKCERALTDAKKDNDFIYHERVPDEKNLAPITKGQLISKSPFGVFKKDVYVRLGRSFGTLIWDDVTKICYDI